MLSIGNKWRQFKVFTSGILFERSVVSVDVEISSCDIQAFTGFPTYGGRAAVELEPISAKEGGGCG